MSIVSITEGEWKQITSAVMGVIETNFAIKTIIKGESEYVMIATDKGEVIDELNELLEMFPKDFEPGLADVDGKNMFSIINKTSSGQDIIIRKVGKLIVGI